MKKFLASQLQGPTQAQFHDWSQRVPVEERELSKAIGQALRAGRSLSSDEAALWDEIKNADLVKMFGYIAGLDPKTVLAAQRRT